MDRRVLAVLRHEEVGGAVDVEVYVAEAWIACRPLVELLVSDDPA